MRTISDTINRKFIEVFNIDEYEILTDTGWEDIQSIGKTIEYDVWEIKTETYSLQCADTHIVFNEFGQEIFVKDLQCNDKIITEQGCETVLSITKLNRKEHMYDIQLSDTSKNHRYYTNGILSHNSTIYCIYALWLSTFFPEKKIMILANKAATALELLGRIETAYEYLPKWLKCSCLEFNKSSITFGNMSSIKAFASSSDAARGFSANCVHKNTKITIRLFKFLKITIPIKWLKFLSK